MAAQLESSGELQLPVLRRIASGLRELLDPGKVRRILDIGRGPGVMTCVLAEAFADAQVVAVDGAPGLLDRALARAERLGLGSRVSVRHAKLPEGLGGGDEHGEGGLGQRGEHTVTVQRGDTLSEIAQEELGDPSRYQEIFEASQATTQTVGVHLSDPNVVDVGWTPTVKWLDLVAVSVVAGVGFTVSLLIGELSFDVASQRSEHVKAAVLGGSLTAAALGGILLTWRSRVHKPLVTPTRERTAALIGLPADSHPSGPGDPDPGRDRCVARFEASSLSAKQV